jgi:hypothetical protein
MNTSKNEKVISYLDWVFKGRSAWWLYIIGVVVLFLNVKFLGGLITLPLTIFLGPLLISSPAGKLITKQFGFIVVFLMPFLFVWLVHRRPAWSVALPKFKYEGWNLAMGFIFSGLTLIIAYALYALVGGVKFSFASPDLQTYLSWFIAAIFVFFIQTSAEELTFRGYFMQAFRRFTANPVVIIVFVGLAFALPHLPNLVGMKLPWYADVAYLIDGSLLAWLAYRTRSLWMPIGWHFANNFLLTTFLGIKNSGDVIEGLPLILGDKVPSVEVLILAKALSSLLSVLILAWLIRRREQKSEV